MGGYGLKYDIHVAPGSDPSLIRFTYEGADDIQLRNGALIVSTSLGRMTERIPLAFQEVDGVRRIITCTYTLKNGVIGVEPGAFNKDLPLVIDPTLSFATYSGSISNNFGYSATFDNAGFLYAGSTAFGTEFPVTMGAYQTVWAGGVGQGAIPAEARAEEEARRAAESAARLQAEIEAAQNQASSNNNSNSNSNSNTSSGNTSSGNTSSGNTSSGNSGGGSTSSPSPSRRTTRRGT